jgi:hypothetical protein
MPRGSKPGSRSERRVLCKSGGVPEDAVCRTLACLQVRSAATRPEGPASAIRATSSWVCGGGASNRWPARPQIHAPAVKGLPICSAHKSARDLRARTKPQTGCSRAVDRLQRGAHQRHTRPVTACGYQMSGDLARTRMIGWQTALR